MNKFIVANVNSNMGWSWFVCRKEYQIPYLKLVNRHTSSKLLVSHAG